MDIEVFQAELEKVKRFEQDEDYYAFVRLTDHITGNEEIGWLDCLLDAICVEDDYGTYESLYNAIWRFPCDMAAKRLAEYLPDLQRRMSHAPFQVWRFYIPIPQKEQSASAFLEAASAWDDKERRTGMDAMKAWCMLSGGDEKAWGPIYEALGGKLPKAVPVDPIPDAYGWPDALKERVEEWRALPPDKNSVRVFWFGGKETRMEEWRADLPRIVEALALRHGEKWRDINVWQNPFSFFARELYPDFVEAMAKAPEDIRDRAVSNIKKARPRNYTDMCDKLKAYGIVPGKAIWPK
ncbi:MAG: hypothetical protein FWH47_00365 [Methanomassiliicoccaceae archaeon]|nr:hypothetical protein [Methanomassiliicoccaceae archaeon]